MTAPDDITFHEEQRIRRRFWVLIVAATGVSRVGTC